MKISNFSPVDGACLWGRVGSWGALPGLQSPRGKPVAIIFMGHPRNPIEGNPEGSCIESRV